MRLTIFRRLTIGYLTIFVLVTAVGMYAILKAHQFNTGTLYILNIDGRILDYKKNPIDSVLLQLRYGMKTLLQRI